jgi:hypothetical protein
MIGASLSSFIGYMTAEIEASERVKKSRSLKYLSQKRFSRRKNFTRFQQMAKANEITEKNLFLGWRGGAIPLLEKQEVFPQILSSIDPIMASIFVLIQIEKLKWKIIEEFKMMEKTKLKKKSKVSGSSIAYVILAILALLNQFAEPISVSPIREIEQIISINQPAPSFERNNRNIPLIEMNNKTKSSSEERVKLEEHVKLNKPRPSKKDRRAKVVHLKDLPPLSHFDEIVSESVVRSSVRVRAHD